ncbi:Uncharacterized protein PHPALM_16923 [Phytophthora palmivora]|uniref:Uncharacterized protein n=1 Tax=Phytophthora palmivora TaxID=4796 RepID=A0A2P4XNK0_9STRA|nr:Uncharacterized protein PHPALM_16923 [Phytophthora palmivora]
MFSQNLDREGSQPCITLVLLMQHGKANTFGKLQHVGFMRNKDVHERLLCNCLNSLTSNKNLFRLSDTLKIALMWKYRKHDVMEDGEWILVKLPTQRP